MRVKCYRCFWPKEHCWCGSITPMASRTKFVILMHSYEFKRIKANTGRLTHLCLADSELFVGEAFDQHEAVQALINDPQNYPVLLYPGKDAIDLSKAGRDEHGAGSMEQGARNAENSVPDNALPAPGSMLPAHASFTLPAPSSLLAAFRSQLHSRRLVIFLLDATWRLARPMLRDSPSLQRLPRVMFSGAAPSRYIIKRQPEPGCLSTLEAVHEMLLALDGAGLDAYTQPTQLLNLFQRMQDFQIERTAENRRLGIRRHAPKTKREVQSVMPPRPTKRRRIFPVSVRSPNPPNAVAANGEEGAEPAS